MNSKFNVKKTCRNKMIYVTCFMEKEDENLLWDPQSLEDPAQPSCGIIMEEFLHGIKNTAHRTIFCLLWFSYLSICNLVIQWSFCTSKMSWKSQMLFHWLCDPDISVQLVFSSDDINSLKKNFISKHGALCRVSLGANLEVLAGLAWKKKERKN